MVSQNPSQTDDLGGREDLLQQRKFTDKDYLDRIEDISSTIVAENDGDRVDYEEIHHCVEGCELVDNKKMWPNVLYLSITTSASQPEIQRIDAETLEEFIHKLVYDIVRKDVEKKVRKMKG